MRKIWKNKCISLKVKKRLYEAIILSALVSSADVWPLTATLTKRLNAEHHRWQRSILGIFWKDRVTNEEVRVRTGQHSMDDILLLHWEVHGFKRGPGRPRTNWRSTVNKDLLRMVRRKWRWQLKTDQTGVEVWPNASTWKWIRVESRSRSRLL